MAACLASCCAPPCQYPCSAHVQRSSCTLSIAGCTLAFGRSYGHLPAALTTWKKVPRSTGHESRYLARTLAKRIPSGRPDPAGHPGDTVGGDNGSSWELDDAREIALADVLGLHYRQIPGPASAHRHGAPPAHVHAFILHPDFDEHGLSFAVLVVTCDGGHGKCQHIDRKKVAAVLGVRTTDLHPATTAQLAGMGLEVCPATLAPENTKASAPSLLLSQLLSVHAKVLVDPAVCSHESITFRARTRTATGDGGDYNCLEVAVADVIRVTGAVIADVSAGKLGRETRPLLGRSAWRAGYLPAGTEVTDVAGTSGEQGATGSVNAVPGDDRAIEEGGASGTSKSTGRAPKVTSSGKGFGHGTQTAQEGASASIRQAAAPGSIQGKDMDAVLPPSTPYNHARKLLVLSQAVDWGHIRRLYALTQTGELHGADDGRQRPRSQVASAASSQGKVLTLLTGGMQPPAVAATGRPSVQDVVSGPTQPGASAATVGREGGGEAAVAVVGVAPGVATQPNGAYDGAQRRTNGVVVDAPLLDVVGVIASKRRVGRLLTFLTLLVPSACDLLAAGGPARADGGADDGSLMAPPLPFASPPCSAEGDAASTRDEPRGYVQVIVGKTLVTAVGEEAAYEMMKRLRVGGAVWVRGRWKPHVLPQGASASSEGSSASRDLITASLTFLGPSALVPRPTDGPGAGEGAGATEERGTQDATRSATDAAGNASPVDDKTDGLMAPQMDGSPSHVHLPRGRRIVSVSSSDTLAEMARCVLPLVGCCDVSGDGEQLERLGWAGGREGGGREGELQGQVRVSTADGPPPASSSQEPVPPVTSSSLVGKPPTYAWMRQPPTSAPPRVAVLGLDCEWRPRDLSGKGNHAPVSLLQLATHEEVFIIDMLWWFYGASKEQGHDANAHADVSQAGGDTSAVPAPSAPASSSHTCADSAREDQAHALGRLLSTVLRSPHAIKLGFDFSYDLKRICLSYPAFAHYFDRVCMLVSIRHLVASFQDYLPPPPPPYTMAVDADASTVGWLRPPRTVVAGPHALSGWSGVRQWGLARVYHAVLGVPLDKTQQASDWGARPLSPAQLRYAATDAWCLLCIYNEVRTAFWAVVAHSKPVGVEASKHDLAVAETEWHLPSSDLSTLWEIVQPRK
eukprot:jgi/Mesvir1/17835/Mv12925-RA.1